MFSTFIKSPMVTRVFFVVAAILTMNTPLQAAETINFGTQPATQPIYIARSIGLLDEIEKAHPDVHEIFFQVFDKGWMEDRI